MAYSSGWLHDVIQVLNRKAAQGSKYGIDGDGIEWEDGDILHANVSFAKGKQALNAGAIDAYAFKKVCMRWTNRITMRSRVKFHDNIYQIIPETFQENRQADELQFLMQLIVNDK